MNARNTQADGRRGLHSSAADRSSASARIAFSSRGTLVRSSWWPLPPEKGSCWGTIVNSSMTRSSLSHEEFECRPLDHFHHADGLRAAASDARSLVKNPTKVRRSEEITNGSGAPADDAMPAIVKGTTRCYTAL